MPQYHDMQKTSGGRVFRNKNFVAMNPHLFLVVYVYLGDDTDVPLPWQIF